MQILAGNFSILFFESSLEAVNELKDSQAESDSAERKKERDRHTMPEKWTLYDIGILCRGNTKKKTQRLYF